MHHLTQNGRQYQELLKEHLAKVLPAKDVDIPFYSIPNTNKQVLLNHALQPNLINPNNATDSDYASYPILETDAVLTADGLKTVLAERLAVTEIARIDYLTFTLHDITFDNYNTKVNNLFERQTEIIKNVSTVLADILGFGVDYERNAGANFYERSFWLQHKAGMVCIGGQKNTVLITIYGTGCTFGKVGWESHLHAWLELFARNPRITRVDLAYDDFDGKLDIDFFDKQDSIGGFAGRGRKPDIQKYGNWKRPNGKGRSIYIGSAQSSKLTRIYEKGKQLGDKDSLWLRVEVQYRSNQFHINNDVLLYPTKRFLASYPCFHVFDSVQQPRQFEVVEREKKITFDHAIAITKKQFGRYLNFFREVYNDDKLLLDILTDIDNKTVPERIDALTIPKMSH
jgi:phage replication initiation protein